MREIRFRGKCIEDCELKGQWLYGHYLKSASHFIAVDQGLVDGHFKLYQVDPETVGQYTGLKDKNGKEIYEKDVCKLDNFTGVVVFSDGCFRISDGRRTAYFISTDCREVEVIGNVFENGELLNDCEEA